MAVIGKIVVGLTAHTAQFYKELSGSRRAVQRWGNAVKAVSRAVAGVALVAGTALAAAVVDSLKSMDATAKMSRKLGISTEALIGYQHAAKLAGISSEQLTTGIGMMMRNLGNLRVMGSKEAKMLKEMGINIDALLAMSPEDAFMSLADSVSKMKDPMQRAYAVTKIFGRAGMEMITVLEGGSKGLKEARQEAERLGITFSAEMGAKAEQANDAMSKLWSSFKGLTIEIASNLAPGIKDLADLFTDLTRKGKGVSAITGAFEGVSNAIRKSAAGTVWALRSLRAMDLKREGSPAGRRQIQAEIDRYDAMIAEFDQQVADSEWAAAGPHNWFKKGWKNQNTPLGDPLKLMEGLTAGIGKAKGTFSSKKWFESDAAGKSARATHTEFRQVASLARLASGVAGPEDRQISLLERIAVGVENTADAVNSTGLDDY